MKNLSENKKQNQRHRDRVRASLPLLLIFFLILISSGGQDLKEISSSGLQSADSLLFYSPENPKIQYTGRIDFSNPRLPRFWAPGVYFRLAFEGPDCDLMVEDEERYGNSHNYLEIILDDREPQRIQTIGKENKIKVARGLSPGRHNLLVCKDTESGIGWLEFAGIWCRHLADPPQEPARKIECIGNSITCGAGSNTRSIPCGLGRWYDQNDAYMSYGARTARLLNAQWHLTAVSGIGLIHSCCKMTIHMPQVFNKIDLGDDSLLWDERAYQPDLVTLCLGQNDGILDSALFCHHYIDFIRQLRRAYPGAILVCLNSPMADERLDHVLKNDISGILRFMHENGEPKLFSFFFTKRFHNGCQGHPDLEEHQIMSEELSGFLRKIMNW
jgi:hypothetical protein